MATDEATPPPIGAVVGRNVQRLRLAYGLTQAELARRAQGTGLRWTRSHVAALEAGNRDSVDLAVLLLLAQAVDCTLSDLFAGEGPVRLTDEAITTRENVRRMFVRGRRVGVELAGRAADWQRRAERDEIDVGGGGVDPETGLYSWYETLPVQADADLAVRLGVLPEVVYNTARRLWDGRTLHQERDRRLAALGDSSANERRARRGHITRELSREIESALAAKPAPRAKGRRNG